jgi:hypothetical protein
VSLDAALIFIEHLSEQQQEEVLMDLMESDYITRSDAKRMISNSIENRDLDFAYFELDSQAFGPSCIGCQFHKTGDLFGEDSKCLNPECFEDKNQAYKDSILSEFRQKHGDVMVYDYEKIEWHSEEGECMDTVPAIRFSAYSDDKYNVHWVCTNKDCKVHGADKHEQSAAEQEFKDKSRFHTKAVKMIESKISNPEFFSGEPIEDEQFLEFIKNAMAARVKYSFIDAMKTDEMTVWQLIRAYMFNLATKDYYPGCSKEEMYLRIMNIMTNGAYENEVEFFRQDYEAKMEKRADRKAEKASKEQDREISMLAGVIKYLLHNWTTVIPGDKIDIFDQVHYSGMNNLDMKYYAKELKVKLTEESCTDSNEYLTLQERSRELMTKYKLVKYEDQYKVLEFLVDASECETMEEFESIADNYGCYYIKYLFTWKEYSFLMNIASFSKSDVMERANELLAMCNIIENDVNAEDLSIKVLAYNLVTKSTASNA